MVYVLIIAQMALLQITKQTDHVWQDVRFHLKLYTALQLFDAFKQHNAVLDFSEIILHSFAAVALGLYHMVIQ